MTKALSLSTKFESALALAAQVKAMVVDSPEAHAALDAKLSEIRRQEASLEAEYKADPRYVAFKDLQAQKSRLSSVLEQERVNGKARLIAWEQEQDAKRLKAEEAIRAQEQKRAEDEALEAALAAGDPQEADAILSAPVIVPSVVLPRTTPKTKSAEHWKFRIINAAAIPVQFKIPDEVTLGRVVRAMKGATNIPGIEVYKVRA